MRILHSDFVNFPTSSFFGNSRVNMRKRLFDQDTAKKRVQKWKGLKSEILANFGY